MLRTTARQLDGVNDLVRTFEDKASGKDTNRPKLQEALKYVREGDTLVVHSMDRLARNMVDLQTVVRDLTTKGVAVEFKKENLTFTGKEGAMATLMLQLLGAVSQFEWAMIKERQMEGIAIAKDAGKYKGRKAAPSVRQVQRYASGWSLVRARYRLPRRTE